MHIELIDREYAPSPTLHINERVDALWRSGAQVFHLGFGESRFPVHPRLRDALVNAAAEKSYLPAKGLMALRRAVARNHAEQLGGAVDAERVMVGPGSKALIYALQMALAADLYLPAPAWVSYAEQARLLGKAVRFIPGRVEADYELELQALDAAISDSGRQQLLIINSPNNPTGRIFTAESLRALADFCRARRMVVLSDEIYARVRQPGQSHHSLASYYPEGTFVVGGISKHLSLGGWRLGVLIAPDSDAGYRALAAMEAIASEIWSAVAAPVQHAAVLAYSNDPEIEQYAATCSEIHSLRTRFYWAALRALGIRSTEPQGGFYLMVNFDHWAAGLAALGIETSPELAAHLLDQHHIATLPGTAFGLPERTLSLRLATSYLDMESDEAASALLSGYESGMSADAFMGPAHHPMMHASLAAFAEFADTVRGP